MPLTNPHLPYKTIAKTSTAPITAQQIALLCSPAIQNPLAALRQRIALVHPLTKAPGLLSILRSFIGLPRGNLLSAKRSADRATYPTAGQAYANIVHFFSDISAIVSVPPTLGVRYVTVCIVRRRVGEDSTRTAQLERSASIPKLYPGA